MKRLWVMFLASVLIANVHSQDYLISFEGSGDLTTVDSVIVNNLTQGTSLTIYGNDQLRLVGNLTGIIPERDNKDFNMSIYPNPTKEFSTVEFIVPQPGVITAELYEISGKKVLQKSEYLEIGTHLMQISGLGYGIHNINLKSTDFNYSGKIVSQNNTKGSPQINFIGQADISINETWLKNKNSEILMQYNTDDRLKLTGYAENYSVVVTDVPTESKSISFYFIACIDFDGNNYKIVKIGEQWWMGENLRTSHFANGDEIPDGTGIGNILGETEPDYWFVYDDDLINLDTYGRLYTWYTVIDNRNICPDGWHIPTDTEWTILTNSLGGLLDSGGKLKEIGTTFWESPNTGATNESGFSALPGGGRNYSGFCDKIGLQGLWWSPIEESATHAWYWYTLYDAENVAKSYGTKEVGFSVRCVRD